MVSIKAQVLATTELDSHGEKLTKDQLHGLFLSQPSEMVIYHQHDFGRPPVALANNLSFVQLPSGEYAITADVVVHDEDAFAQCGGFSMAWLADEYSIRPESEPALKIYFNPRIFFVDEAIELISASTNDDIFNARELKQKALDSAAILILKFIAASAIAGFFGKSGADAYDKLRAKIAALASHRRERGETVVLHMIVPPELNSLQAEVVLEIPADLTEHVRLGSLSYESAMAVASKVPYANSARKIVVRTHGNPPQWTLSHYVRSDGMPVRI